MPASRAKRAEGKSLEADVRGARIAMPSRLEKLAAVRGRFQRLDVEAALGRHLEGGPRRIAPPFRARPDVGPAGQAGQQLAADDRHPFRPVGAEVVFAGADDADGAPPSVALEPQALHVAVEVAAVFG